jgi:hypothetical protein
MRILDRMSIIGDDIVRFRDLQEQALKFVRILNNMENKHVVAYCLGANLMIDVERQSHVNRDRRIIVGYDRLILDSQEQTSEIAMTSNCVGTRYNLDVWRCKSNMKMEIQIEIWKLK